MQVSEAMGMLFFIHFFSDHPYSTFKPGQDSLERDYFSKATNDKPDGEKNLKNYARFVPEYHQNVS